jgi:eukaryotic-like serine/threonine-protein kinase
LNQTPSSDLGKGTALVDSTLTIGNRYRILNQIGKGGMGAVYRAQDRLTGEIVALKQVLVSATDLQFATRGVISDSHEALLGLAQEFRTLAGLRHPNIVAVLDYGFDTPAPDKLRQPYFTMQYIEDARTLTDYAGDFDIPTQVRFLIAMLQALTYLHRRGIVHRDLKPANVLVTADGVVKVMDFGLALSQSESSVYQGTVGTIAYMSPELFAGESATVQSDLYAAGIMAYELLIGEHPFNIDRIGDLIYSTMNDAPYTSMLDKELGDVIQRLLAKSPSARYDNADEAIAALCAATNQPLPEENALLRESFLQAAAFVGREEEFNKLHTALQEVVVKTDKGSAWLVGGESGVGKSRLMDELQTRALVAGCVVLRGQSVEGGGLPYQLWRAPLRRLTLSAELSDLEAGILKELIPDIATLLGRDIPNVPELVGAAGQQRLILTILDVFKRQRAPMMLMLEDLHWAVESLEPLRALVRFIDELPLLIVATYRDDEHPDLPADLAQMQAMKLARLNTDAISQLSVSMLGDAGKQEHIVSLLQRETEGNVFFLVEVVRALAEKAGRLSDIGSMTLPHQIFAGGVRAVVQRRLARVPQSLQSLLKLAAVAGRQIDLAIMQNIVVARTQHVASLPDKLDEWLVACANAAVLEVVDGQWRFAHDKIREGLLAELSDERPALHRQVALAIESVYPDDPAWAEVLIDHWQQAGDHAKEVKYVLVVADRLIQYSADYQRALMLLERAVTLTNDDLQRMKLFKLLGDGYDKIGAFDKANPHYQESLRLAEHLDDTRGRADVLRNMGQLAQRRGDYPLAAQLTQQSLDLYRQIGERAGIASSVSLLGVLARIRGDFPAAVAYQQEGLGLRREANDLLGIGASLNNLGNLAYTQGDYAAAREYHSQSMEVKRQINDRAGLGLSLNNLGVVCVEQKDYAAARDYYLQSLALRREINDRVGIGGTLNNLGIIAFDQEDYTAARDYYNQSIDIRREIPDRPGIAETLVNRAGISLRLGELDEARHDLVEAVETAYPINAAAILLEALANYAELLERTGEHLKAVEWASLLDAHPAVWSATKENRIKPLLTRLATHLAPETYQAAVERGKELQLADVIAQIIPASTKP